MYTGALQKCIHIFYISCTKYIFFCYQTNQNNYNLFQKNDGRENKLEVYSDIKLEAIIVSVLMLGLIENAFWVTTITMKKTNLPTYPRF